MEVAWWIKKREKSQAAEQIQKTWAGRVVSNVPGLWVPERMKTQARGSGFPE